MILVYIIKCAISLSVLYSLYGLLLRRETYYKMNRIVLVGIMLASFILPLVHVTVDNETVVHQTMSAISEQLTISAGSDAVKAQQSEARMLPLVLFLVYVLGVMALAVRYVVAAAKVCRIIISSKKEKGCYVNDSVESPFSWFNCIVISSADLHANAKELLAHERAHVQNFHSYDLLLCEIITCLQWWNPFAWMLRTDLCAVHEYEADYIVTHQADINDMAYKMLLINKATECNTSSIVNCINHYSLTERLKQMYRKPSTKAALLKVLYVLPLTAFVTFCFARPRVVGEIEQAIVREEASLMQKVASVLPDAETADTNDAMAEESPAEDEIHEERENADAELAIVADKIQHASSDEKPCFYDLPLNTNNDILYNGFYIKRLPDATHLVCVGTCESDDEVVTLGGEKTSIEDAATGNKYKALGALPDGCWGTFHICNMKGKTFSLTLVFPPLPDEVKYIRLYNMCSWITPIYDVYDLDKISER